MCACVCGNYITAAAAAAALLFSVTGFSLHYLR
jgi:hypothetical protein